MTTCPRDSSPLRSQPVALGGVARCPTCEGVWLPGTVVERSLGKVPHPDTHGADGTFTTLQCPDDRALLFAITHHGVELDLCLTCTGVWLDPGEIVEVLEARRDSSRAGDSSHAPEATEGAFDRAVDKVGALLEFVAEALQFV